MTNPIIECINAVGLNIYAVIKNRITGYTWNTATNVWEAFNPANWLSYAIPLTADTGSGYYQAARPAGVVGSLVSDVFYIRAGASPATSDAPPFNLLHGEGENIAAVNADPAVAPQNMAAAFGSEVQGAVAAGTLTNSSFPTSVTGYANNLLVGRSLIFLTGANAKAACAVLAYNGSTGVFTVSPLPGAPAATDEFIVV